MTAKYTHTRPETLRRQVEQALRSWPESLRARLDLRDRHAAGEISRHGLAVARGRLENQLSDLVFPPKTNAANERLAQHLWTHRDGLFTFLRQPGLDATNWRAEVAIRFGVLLRKVWGGSRTWAGARAQSVLMSVWRTCWPGGLVRPGPDLPAAARRVPR
jgi:transposase